MTEESFLKPLLQLANEASEAILKVYRSGDFNMKLKDDKSPVTKADLASHMILSQGLSKIKSVPVLSEEESLPYETRSQWQSYWLVDPLDGTKDFLRQNDEFTINIALLENSIPIFGLVVVPASGEQFWGYKNGGAFKNGTPICNNRQQQVNLIGLESRFHSNQYVHWFFDHFPISEVKKCGSALKICRVAEGQADVYPRLGPTSEWDTAAGHVIANESNCHLINLFNGKELNYAKEDLRNPPFIASRKDLSWNLEEIRQRLAQK